MRVSIDSNIIFAIYSIGSIPYQAIIKSLQPPYKCLICEQCFDEVLRKYQLKYPHKIDALKQFIDSIKTVVEIIPVPDETNPDEEFIKLRDPDDALIFRAALAAKADIIISGDKDFLESAITKPKIVTAADFVNGEF